MGKFLIGDIVRGDSSGFYRDSDIDRITEATVIGTSEYAAFIRPNISGSFYSVGGTYWINARDLTLISHAPVSGKAKRVHCAHCGAASLSNLCEKDTEGNYICSNCYDIKNGDVLSTNVVHKPSSTHKTYGFELECVPKSIAHQMSAVKYGLIPTFDGSLPDNGIEFKTPIYNGLNGVRRLLHQFNNHLEFKDSRCGQHINIGDSSVLNQEYLSNVRTCANKLFDPLYEYMNLKSSDTQRICGRYFTHYANHYNSYTTHNSWINLSEDNRIEFRLSKFVNPDQYFCLINMWTEMLDCIIHNFHPMDSNFDDAVCDSISQMLIEIFKKYARFEAKCQKYQTKLRTA